MHHFFLNSNPIFTLSIQDFIDCLLIIWIDKDKSICIDLLIAVTNC